MRKIILSTLAFIAMATSASAELYTPVEYPYAATVIATLKVRSWPSSNNTQIDEVRRGDKLHIQRCENGFCYADRLDGRISGWVHSNYFVPTGPVEKPAVVLQPRPEMSDRIIMRPTHNLKLGF